MGANAASWKALNILVGLKNQEKSGEREAGKVGGEAYAKSCKS